MEKIKVIIDRAKDGTYNVYCEDTPSFFGMGDTIDEAKAEMLESIRITKEEFSKELCFRFQKPIVSTSANISGEPTPQTFDEISDEIKNAVDYVVKYSQRCKEKHQPSSIIKINADGEFTIIRK